MSSEEFTIKQKQFFNTHQTHFFVYEDNIPYARYMVGKLMQHIPKKGAIVLEIGAGQGRFTLELARHVARVTAVDIADRAIDILKREAKKKHIRTIDASVQDILTIGKALSKDQFDAIVGILILHHLPKNQLESVVQQLKHSLRSGGRLCFIEPNNTYPFYIFAMLLRPDMKWEYEKGTYTNFIGTFKRACIAQGLVIVESKKFGLFPPSFINRWPKFTAIARVVERIPILRDTLCPFILIAAQRSGENGRTVG